MSAMFVMAVCLLAVTSACDICGDPTHQQPSGGSTGGEQQQKQQQMMQMMTMFNMMQQHKNWGNGGNTGNTGNTGSNPRPPPNPNAECDGFSDVVILLDSSGSIGVPNFQKQLEFLAGLVGKFQLAYNVRTGYQFSVVSFSDAVKEEFNLKMYTTTSALQGAIGRIPYMSSGTKTDMGLNYIAQNSFLSSKGGRAGAVKIVLVITDGRSENSAGTKQRADELRKSGAIVLAIGVGNDIFEDELEWIASTKTNVFRVENFEVLGTIEKMVEKRTCDITIEGGGGIDASGSGGEVDQATLRKWELEIERRKGEEKLARDLLAKFKDFDVKVTKDDHEKEKEEKGKQDLAYMTGKVEKMKSFMAETEHVHDHLAEIKHHYMYMVTSEVIKFCPMEDMESDVMRIMIHGSNKWSPGRADQCNVEDMSKVNNINGQGQMTAAQVAEQIANLSQKQQVEVFFSGAKDAVCAGLKAYVTQVKEWEDKFPNLKRMMGIMF